MSVKIRRSARGRQSLRLLPLALLGASFAVAAAPARPDQFNRVFAAEGEPRYLHYQVMYQSNGAIHRLEVWREGDKRIKRLTDDTVASYAFHPAPGPGYRLSVLDLKRRIHTLVDRTNLYRIGAFADWYDLGHGLRHPMGPYTLAPGKPMARVPWLPAVCHWYDLTQEGGTTHICWDSQDHLPLLIADANNRILYRVLSIDPRPFPAGVFTINDKGFVRNNANQDISPD